MSALALTLIRLGFLAILWIFVLVVAGALRRDLVASQDTPIADAAPRRHHRPASRRSRGQKRPATSLVVVHGSLAGTVLPLGAGPVTIGRAPDCALAIADDYASSHHAQLSLADGSWIVQDLGSTNGTWIDRSRITGPTVLDVGAPLRIGRTILELRK